MPTSSASWRRETPSYLHSGEKPSDDGDYVAGSNGFLDRGRCVQAFDVSSRTIKIDAVLTQDLHDVGISLSD